MSNYTVTAATKPKLQAKSIYFKVKLDDQTLDAVAFLKDLPSDFKNVISNLNIGDTIAFVGRKKINPYTNREELVIQTPAQTAMTVEEALSMPDKDLVPVEERVMPERKYTYFDKRVGKNISFWSDGLYAWLEGQKHKKQKMTYEFLEVVNNNMVDKHPLLPDWYSLETIERMKNDPLQIKLMEEFAIY
jgi:hypothetical protein